MQPLDQLTDEQLLALEKQRQQNVDPQRMRTAVQGLTFNWGDEAEAFMRSQFSDRQYEDILSEVRKQISDYQSANPGASFGYEMAGAFLPTAVAAVVPGAQTAVVPTLMRLAKIGATEGAVSGAGAAEGDFADTLTAAAINAPLGAVGGVAGAKTIQGAGALLKGLIDKSAQQFGPRASDAVRAEIQRLQQQTGLSPDEIIQRLQDGRLMSENVTLQNALRGYVVGGGEAGQDVLQKIGQQAQTREAQAVQSLRNELAPGADDNVIKTRIEATEQEKILERDMYSGVFQQYPRVDTDIAETILEVAGRNPTIITDVEDIYRVKGIPPLFGKDESGKLIPVRLPSLEDAEIIRRVVKENATTAYKSGRGTLGEVLADQENQLRTKIDNFAPDLMATRARAAAVRNNRSAFEAGRKGLNMNVDELQVVFGEMNDEAKDAFRMGLMGAISNRIRSTRGGTTIRDLAKNDSQFGLVLRTVLNDRDIDSLQKQLELSGDVTAINRGIQPNAGSQTAPLTSELNRQGTGAVLDVAGDMATGNYLGLTKRVMDMVTQRIPEGLTDSQKQEVVSLLFETDPRVLSSALKDTADVGPLLKLIDGAVARVASGTSRGIAATASDYSTGVYNEVMNEPQ